MNTRAKRLLLGVAMTAVTVSAAAQPRNDANDIDWTKELSSRITINGYAQAGWAADDKTGKTNNAYNLKRTLMWARARITDRWSFLFMHDFSSVVQEFYTDFRVTNDKSLTVRFGQYKNSFSMENPLSPVQLELIDICSMVVTQLSGCYDPLQGSKPHFGRDMGLTIYGDVLDDHLHYELALMSGQGINVKDGNNDKDLIAKVDVRPMKGLRLVASGYLGTGHAVGTAEWNPDIHVGDDYRRNRYSVGAELKSGSYCETKYKKARPVSIRAEWLGGKDGSVCSRGGYVTTTIPLVDGLDAVASAETFNQNVDVKGWQQTRLTGGLQYWFYGNCRLQLQYTRSFCGENINNKDYNWLQAQMQVAF